MIDFLLLIVYFVLAIALAVTAWAIIRTFKIVGKTSGRTHGIPVRTINLIVVACILVVMVLSFTIGSTTPMRINAEQYNDTLWLRMANMFVFTGVTAIIAGACAMAYSYFIILRKHHATKD